MKLQALAGTVARPFVSALKAAQNTIGVLFSRSTSGWRWNTEGRTR